MTPKPTQFTNSTSVAFQNTGPGPGPRHPPQTLTGTATVVGASAGTLPSHVRRAGKRERLRWYWYSGQRSTPTSRASSALSWHASLRRCGVQLNQVADSEAGGTDSADFVMR